MKKKFVKLLLIIILLYLILVLIIDVNKTNAIVDNDLNNHIFSLLITNSEEDIYSVENINIKSKYNTLMLPMDDILRIIFTEYNSKNSKQEYNYSTKCL